LLFSASGLRPLARPSRSSPLTSARGDCLLLRHAPFCWLLLAYPSCFSHLNGRAQTQLAARNRPCWAIRQASHMAGPVDAPSAMQTRKLTFFIQNATMALMIFPSFRELPGGRRRRQSDAIIPSYLPTPAHHIAQNPPDLDQDTTPHRTPATTKKVARLCSRIPLPRRTRSSASGMTALCIPVHKGRIRPAIPA